MEKTRPLLPLDLEAIARRYGGIIRSKDGTIAFPNQAIAIAFGKRYDLKVISNLVRLW